MNTLAFNFPNNSHVTLDYCSGTGTNSAARYFNSTSSSITGNETIVNSLAPNKGLQTNRISVASGAAPYTGSIVLGSDNAFPGAIMKYYIEMPASVNPTIQIIDSVTSGILLSQVGETGAFPVFAEFEYSNQWNLQFWA